MKKKRQPVAPMFVAGTAVAVGATGIDMSGTWQVNIHTEGKGSESFLLTIGPKEEPCTRH